MGGPVPGGRAVGQHGDHRDQQARGGQRGQRILLAALSGLVRGQGRVHARVGGADVIAELLSAWVQMPGHLTDPMPRGALAWSPPGCGYAVW